jgi:hypothetical protein
MLRHVTRVITDVSEELSASVIRVVVPSSPILVTLMMEALRSILYHGIVFLRSVCQLRVTVNFVPSSPTPVTLMNLPEVVIIRIYCTLLLEAGVLQFCASVQKFSALWYAPEYSMPTLQSEYSSELHVSAAVMLISAFMHVFSDRCIMDY